MPEPLEVRSANRRREDAITAAWLEDEGPYVVLPSQPNDEEPEGILNLGTAGTE